MWLTAIFYGNASSLCSSFYLHVCSVAHGMKILFMLPNETLLFLSLSTNAVYNLSWSITKESIISGKEHGIHWRNNTEFNYEIG